MASAPEDLILDKCMKFHDYDFNGDNSFQIGWKNIAMQSSKDNQTEPFLKAKLFYYSKIFERITFEEYETWLREEHFTPEHVSSDEDAYSTDLKQQSGDENILLKESESCLQKSIDITYVSDINSDLNAATAKNTSISRKEIIEEHWTSVSNSSEKTLSSKGSNESAISDAAEASYPISFTDIVSMLAEGKTLPGIKDLNIKSIDVEPTESTMERKKKPWE